MNASTQVVALWQCIKQKELVLVFIGMLIMPVLLGLVGAGISHATQGAVPPAVPHGGLMAPTPPSGGGGDAGPSSIAATNGNIHVGE